MAKWWCYLPTTLDTQKQRHTPQSLPISAFHTLVLSPIENQMRQAYAHTAKHWRQKNPCQEQEVPKNKEKMSD